MKSRSKHFLRLLFCLRVAFVIGVPVNGVGWGKTVHHAIADLGVVGDIISPDFAKEEVQWLSSQLGIRIRAALSLDHIEAGIAALQSKGIYQKLWVETDKTAAGLTVILRGARSKKVRELHFTGVDDTVLDELKDRTNYDQLEKIEAADIEMLRSQLRQVYEEHGYYGVQIEIKWINKEKGKLGSIENADVEFSVKQGEVTKVERIHVTGASPDENRAMLSVVPLRVGDVFAKSFLDDGIKRINQYLQSNQYPTSKVEEAQTSFSDNKEKARINIVVKLNEKYIFEFKGNTVFEDINLRELLTSEVLSQLDAAARISSLVEAKYRSVGYHFCRVRVELNQESNQGATLIRFVVDEGPKVIIDNVHFTGGMGEMSQPDLKKLFFDNSPPIIQRRVYWEDGLSDAVGSLKVALNKLGFLNVNLTQPRVVFSSDRKGAELFFDIELGTRTTIGSIELLGVTQLTPEKFSEITGLKTTEHFDREKVIEARQTLVTYYQNRGFADVKLKDDADQDAGIILSRDFKQARLRFEVDEGVMYRVGALKVEGLRKTKEKVVLREMELKTGEVFDSSQVQRSEEKISSLGLFSKVEIVAVTNEEKKEVKDLRIVVRETPPGLGEVGLGGFYEDPFFRLRTFVGVAYRNVGGLNQTASTRAEVSLPLRRQGNLISFVEYSGTLAYRAPYPFEIPLVFTGQFIFDSFEAAQLANQDIVIQARTSIEGKVEKKFARWLTGFYRLYKLEKIKTDSLDNTVPSTTNVIGSTGPGMIFDFRDDPLNPTKGSFHTLTLELASPVLLSDTPFYMANWRNSFYTPLVFGLDLQFSGTVGYASSFNSGQSLPAARLASDLALGGQGSIRGFNVSSITAFTTASVIPVTQMGFWNARVELGIPLIGNYKLAAFWDSGQIFPNNVAQTKVDGVGLGIRYKLPVGPIVVDFAQGLGSQGGFKFYFTIGTL